jgi:hypothetical protein
MVLKPPRGPKTHGPLWAKPWIRTQSNRFNLEKKSSPRGLNYILNLILLVPLTTYSTYIIVISKASQPQSCLL